MKILYIDHVSHREHLNFNIMHLSALLKITKDVDCVFKEHYLDNTTLDNIKLRYSIPSYLCKKRKNGFANRFFYWLTLCLIRFHINLKDYDFIILSYYDEITLHYAFYPKNLFLINHINVSGLNSKVKFYFYKKLSSNNTHIVFENYIKDYLISKGINNVEVVPHGIIDKYVLNDYKVKQEYKNIYSKYDYVIFSPSSSSSDEKFMKELLLNHSFNNMLLHNNILFIAKTNIRVDCQSNNILIINSFLSDEDYKFLFLKSNLILISYPNTFKYRVSAVFFEAISNNKRLQIADIDAFEPYKKYLPSVFYFDCIDELISNITQLQNDNTVIKYNTMSSLLTPDYSHIIL